MHYSFLEQGWSQDKFVKLSMLLSCQDIQIFSKKSGGNSIVYCIGNLEKKWAVKIYPPYATDQRDRLSVEKTVYEFLNQNNIPSVPNLKAYDNTERWLIIDWIDGEIPNSYSEHDIEQAIAFLKNIYELNTTSQALLLPCAAEPCLSLNTLLNQIKRRFQNLLSISDQEADLSDFLINHFSPNFEHYQLQATEGFKTMLLNPDAELLQEKCSLIPADFGFHNTIRDHSGRLFFFDFDYFGWDDPVKLLADILWHPKMNLSTPQQQQFIQGLSQIYNSDCYFSLRFHYLRPLFGLRWVLILLNEFLPTYWQNRQHAQVFKNRAGNQAEAKQLQLIAAKHMLSQIEYIGNPYETIITASI